MKTRNVGTTKLLTPDQKCTDHAVTFQYSIGLPSTDDPLIGEIVTNFEFSKLTKKKNCFQLSGSNHIREKLTSGYHNYPLKGLNLRYMYCGKNDLLNKLKYINTSRRKWYLY